MLTAAGRADYIKNPQAYSHQDTPPDFHDVMDRINLAKENRLTNDLANTIKSQGTPDSKVQLQKVIDDNKAYNQLTPDQRNSKRAATYGSLDNYENTNALDNQADQNRSLQIANEVNADRPSIQNDGDVLAAGVHTAQNAGAQLAGATGSTVSKVLSGALNYLRDAPVAGGISISTPLYDKDGKPFDTNWKTDPLGKMIQGLDGISDQADTNMQNNQLQDNPVGRVSQNMIRILPDIAATALAPEAMATEAPAALSWLGEHATAATKIGEALTSNFAKWMGIKQAAEGYGSARRDGMSPIDATEQAFTEGGKGYFSGSIMHMAGGIGGEATNIGMKSLIDAGFVKPGMQVLTRAGMRAAVDAGIFAALPIGEASIEHITNLITGDKDDPKLWEKAKEEAISGAGMGIGFSFLGAMHDIGEKNQQDKHINDILNYRQGVAMQNFATATPEAIKEAFDNPTPTADLNAKAIEYAGNAKKEADPEKRKQLILLAQTFAKTSDVQGIAHDIVNNKDAVISAIQEANIPDASKQQLIAKINDTHKQLDVTEQKKADLGNKIKELDASIKQATETAATSTDPVEKATAEVAVEKLTSQREGLNNALKSIISNQIDGTPKEQIIKPVAGDKPIEPSPEILPAAESVPAEPKQESVTQVDGPVADNKVVPAEPDIKKPEPYNKKAIVPKYKDIREHGGEDTPENLAKATNEKTWYHGSNKDLTNEHISSAAFTRPDSLLGLGFYMTDNPEIAETYANLRRNKSGSTVNEFKVKTSKILDAEKPIDKDVEDTYKKVFQSLFNTKQDASEFFDDVKKEKPNASMIDYHKAIRDFISDEHLPTNDVVEHFQDLEIGLKDDLGYDGISHIGGVQTKGKNHNVTILLDPAGEYTDIRTPLTNGPFTKKGLYEPKYGELTTTIEKQGIKTIKLDVNDDLKQANIGLRAVEMPDGKFGIFREENGKPTGKPTGKTLGKTFDSADELMTAYDGGIKDKLTSEAINKASGIEPYEHPIIEESNLTPEEHTEVNELLKPEDITTKDIQDYEQHNQSDGGEQQQSAVATDAETVQQSEPEPAADAEKNSEDKSMEGSTEPAVDNEGDTNKNKYLTDEEVAERDALKKKFRIKTYSLGGAIADSLSKLFDADHYRYMRLEFKESKGEFKDWAKNIIDTFGESIREHLPYLFIKSGGEKSDIPKDILTPEVEKKLDSYSQKVDKEVRNQGSNEFNKPKHDWLGNIAVDHARADAESANFQDEIKASVPEPQKGQKKQDWKDVDQAIHIYLDLKRNPEHLKEYYDSLTDKQKRIVDISQNLTDAQKDIADRISQEYKDVSKQMKDAGLINQTLDNYVSRAWNFEGKPMESMSKFGLSTRHSLQRSLDTILQGWAKGYDLKIEGATNNLAILKKEVSNVIENRNLIEAGSKIPVNSDGDKLFTTYQQDGYKLIDIPGFKKWAYVGKIDADQDGSSVMGKRKNILVTEDGTILEKQDVYAPTAVAKRLNDILGTSKLRGLPAIDKISKLNSVVKETVLSTSLFHHLAFTRNRFLSGKIEAGLNYKDGLKSMKEMGPEIEIGIRNGLTLGKIQDWDETALQYKGWISKKLEKYSVTKAISDKIGDLTYEFKRGLFDRYGAGLKAADFISTFKREIAKNPLKDPNDIAREISEAMNNNYGGINLKQIERNPTTQHVMHLLLLAPDWTESNIRMAVKAFKGGYEGDFTRRMWGKVLLRGAATVALSNLAMSLLPDPNDDSNNVIERMKQRYERAWKEGGLDWMSINISPIAHALGSPHNRDYYFPLFGHYSDPLKLATQMIDPKKGMGTQFFINKGSIAVKLAGAAVTAKDWRGDEYTDLDELLGLDDKGQYKKHVKATEYHEEHFKGEDKGGKLKGELSHFEFGASGTIFQHPAKIPSFTIDQGKDMMPLQVSNTWAWATGQTDGFYSIANDIGLGIKESALPVEKKEK